MIPFHRVAGQFYNRPLYVLPSVAETVSAYLLSRIDARSGRGVASEQGIETVEYHPATQRPGGALEMHSPRSSRFVGEWRTGRDGRPQPYRTTDRGVAIITVIGELCNRGAWIGASSGLVSYEGLMHQIDSAGDDPDVRAIVIDAETPGGEAIGCVGMAASVRRAAERKPVFGIANGMAASAGYALLSGCTRIVAIPDALVGSIGTVLCHLDFSEYLANEGVKPTMIYAGAHKVDGNPYEKLSADVRASLQAEVDRFYDKFVGLVAEGRRGLSAAAARATEARIFVGADAVDAGLVDEIGTFEDVIHALSSSPAGRRNGGAAQQIGGDMSRKNKPAVPASIITQSAGVAAETETPAADQATPKAGPGSCSECECGEFVGDGETCEREECGHAYDSHAEADAGDGEGDGEGGGADDTSEGGSPKAAAPIAAGAVNGEESELERLRRENAALRAGSVSSEVDRVIADAVQAMKFGAADPKGKRVTLAGELREVLILSAQGQSVPFEKMKGIVALMPPAASAGKLPIQPVKEEAATSGGEHAAVSASLTERGIMPGSSEWLTEYPKALAELRRAAAK